jgi:hypothetical protein
MKITYLDPAGAKSARVRPIGYHARTRRMPSALIRKIQQNLSGLDFARSADHRRRFASGGNAILAAPAKIEKH